MVSRRVGWMLANQQYFTDSPTYIMLTCFGEYVYVKPEKNQQSAKACNQNYIPQQKYETVWELLRSIKILNVYQINILNNTALMHQISTKTAPGVFLSKLKKPSHLYPTRFSNVSYIKLTYKPNKCKFRISIRAPYLWMEFLTQKKQKVHPVLRQQ